MNILWTSNITFPEIAKLLNLKIVNIGGWLVGLASILKDQDGVNLGIVSIDNVNKTTVIRENNITFYVVPNKSVNIKAGLNNSFDFVINDFKPDILHINGTELPFALSLLKLHPEILNVVSIQGLVSIYARYFSTGYTFEDIIKNPILFLYLYRGELGFKKCGKIEQEVIRTTSNIIGRTEWDRIHCNIINSDAEYHFCNETLRPVFYTKSWNIQKCERFRIFISQAAHTTKGFHLILPAIKNLTLKYPNLKIKVSGNKPWGNKSKFNIPKLIYNLFGYGNYIKKKINDYELNDFIEFTGNLDENQMVEQLQKAHIFLLPSAIENSPNSLGEAQLIGVPAIASYVGGVPSMTHDKTNVLMYRCTEWEMLVELITSVFENDDLSEMLSINSRKEAVCRHSQSQNVKMLLDIYNKITKKE